MNILITGGAGFIGSHLSERLFDAGHDVWGIDNFLTGSIANTHVGGSFSGIDITDRRTFYDRANRCKPELVIHCAASYSDPNLWHRDAETNVGGTINATLAAKHHGARLFYFNTALPPINSYAISKIAGGQYIEQSGVNALTFRLSNIYGPRNLSGPIPTFYKRLSAYEKCTVVDTVRDMVYIDDLVRAVMSAVGKPDVSGTVDICSGRAHRIIDLFYAVARELGHGDHPEELDAPEGDVKQMALDPTRAAMDLNWTATTDLADGVREAVAWYDNHGVTDTYTHLAMKG